MALLEEISDLRDHLLPWLIAFAVAAVAVFSVGLGTVVMWGVTFPVPVPSTHSFAVMLFEAFRADLVPGDVVLVATSPASVFGSEMNIAFLVAFVLTLPLLIYQVSAYVAPALYVREKRAVFALLAPSTLLFLAGAIFAYLVVIPPMFRILYSFNLILNVAPFLHIEEFISWVLGTMFATGAAFLLPVFMFLSSRIGVIEPRFWGAHWRGAVMTCLIVAAFAIPDPSGLTMILVALPLIGLYGVGFALSVAAKRGVSTS